MELKSKDEFIEKYKKMDPDFEQSYYSRTAKGSGHHSIRLIKWMVYYDKF